MHTLLRRFWGAVLLLLTVAPLAAQSAPTGRFQARMIALELTAGRATFTGPRGVMVEAAVSVEGGRIAFQDIGGLVACVGAEGRYEWRLSGDTLRFRVIEDPCEGRRGALSAPWVRVAGALVLTGVTLIDGTGAPPRTGITLVLTEGRIAAIHPDGAAPLPEGASVRPLTGHWVVPGLVDAHVHVATNPSVEDRRDRVERRLRNALRGGVVAVRDMGGDARALADLSRAALAADLEIPLIRYGAILAGPEFFDDPRVRASSAGFTPGTAPWARAVTDTTDLRQVVAEAKGAGASAVKLYANLDAGRVARIAGEAGRQGLAVWSHLALIPARPSEVVRSGPRVVSHATLLAWEATAELTGAEQRLQVDPTVTGEHPAVRDALRAMRERDVLFEPTLFVYRADSTLPDTSRARRREAQALAMVRAAHAAGVRIVAGTDGIGGEEEGAIPNIHEEMRQLVRAGLSPMEALVAATRHGAEAAGIAGTHGTVAVGKTADLLVLRADPLADIGNTRAIALVLRRGAVVAR